MSLKVYLDMLQTDTSIKLQQAEQGWRESRERLELALRGGDLDLWDYDVPTHQVTFNKRWGQTLGYTLDEVRHHQSMSFWVSLVHPEDLPALVAAYRQHLKGETPAFQAEFRLRAKSGEWKWIAANGQVVARTPDGYALRATGVHRDVTARRQLEEQFRQAQKMDAVGQMAGGIAHDFNNLLTVIGGYAALALEYLRPGDPVLPHLTEIKNAAERASALTQQLLTFSRKQIVQPRILALNEVLHHTERMLRRLIGENITLDTVFAPHLWHVQADPNQLEQVLVNLAVNARDAMPHYGRLTIETANVWLDETYTALHAGVMPGEYVMLAVSDTGCGMNSAIQARIFEPFFTTKERGQGTGLGLATVYGIVQQSGGHVWVYSEPEHGTTFKVYLPRTLAAPEMITIAPPLDLPSGTESILLVEDDADVRRLSAEILRECGYAVTEAANGQEALIHIRNHEQTIDLLITDVVMPNLGGRLLVEQAQLVRPVMPTLYMSGYTEDAVLRHGVLQHGVAFLGKPFVPLTLAQRVRQLLDQVIPATAPSQHD